MAGYREFQTGEVLTAGNVNSFLMNQAVMVFADEAARTSALSGALTQGMVSYLVSTDSIQYYDGSSWRDVGSAGVDPFLLMGG